MTRKELLDKLKQLDDAFKINQASKKEVKEALYSLVDEYIREYE